jgi:quinol-cytochrome oxidoreductase complex cytochrome b subunit
MVGEIRSSWSANLMIFMAFAHMFSVAFLRAYRKPRELTWMSGWFCCFSAPWIRVQWLSPALQRIGAGTPAPRRR